MSWIRQSNCSTTWAVGRPFPMSFPAHWSITTAGWKLLDNMAGIRSLIKGSSALGYMNVDTSNPCLVSWCPNPRNKDVPMTAIKGLSGAPGTRDLTVCEGLAGVVAAAQEGPCVAAVADGDLATSCGGGGRLGGEEPTLSITTGSGETEGLDLCRRLTGMKSPSLSSTFTAANKDLATDTTCFSDLLIHIFHCHHSFWKHCCLYNLTIVA